MKDRSDIIDRMAWQMYLFSPHANETEPYWFQGDESYGTYCWRCAKIEYGFEDRGDGGIDGGWSSEQDGCLHCSRCGRLLEYSLTDYGTREEIAHYIANPPVVLTPEEAYHIERALTAAARLEDLWQDAFIIGLRALAAIPCLPSPSPRMHS